MAFLGRRFPIRPHIGRPLVAPASPTTEVGGFILHRPNIYINPASPINWVSPLNQGLLHDWTIVPNPGWRGGLTLRDLVRGAKNPNDGVLSNGANCPTWVGGVDGLAGGLRLFNGTSQTITIDTIPLPLSFTVSVLFRPNVVSGLYQELIGLNTTYPGIYIWPDGTIMWYAGTAFATNTVLSVGELYHFVVACNLNVQPDSKLYLNGVLDKSGNIFTLPNPSFNRIGSDGSQGLNGTIYSIQFYNRTLADSEVQALYKETKTGNRERFNWMAAPTFYSLASQPPYIPTASNIGIAHTRYRYRNKLSLGSFVNVASSLNWIHSLNRGLVGDWTIVPNPGWQHGNTLHDLVRGGRNPHDGVITRPIFTGGVAPGTYASLFFDGSFSSTVQKVQCPIPLSGTGSFTVASYFQYDGAGGYRDVAGGQNNPGIFTPGAFKLGTRGDTNKWFFSVSDNAGNDYRHDGSAATAGIFQLIGTFDVTSGVITLYKNGVKDTGTPATLSGTRTEISDLFIGTGYSGGQAADFWTGYIFGTQLWSRCLSADEIKNFYQETLLGNPNRYRWLNNDSRFQGPVSNTSIINITTSLIWDVLAHANRTCQEVWNVRGLTAKIEQLIWNARTLAGNTDNFIWNDRALAGNTEQLLWNLQAHVNATIQLLWDTLSSTTVNSTCHLNWNVRALVNHTENIIWNSRALVDRTAQLAWNTKQLSTKSDNLIWGVRQLAGETTQLVWDVYSLTTATNNVVLRWNVLAHANRAAALLWNDRAFANKTASLIWDDRITVGNQEQLKWSVRQLVGATEALLWNARSRAGKTTSVVWNDLITLSRTTELFWNDKITVGAAKQLLYNLRSLSKRDVSLLWRALRTKSIIQIYELIFNITTQHEFDLYIQTEKDFDG